MFMSYMSLIKRIIWKFDSRRKFISSLPVNPKVLDMGCGDGLNGKIVADNFKNFDLKGIDIYFNSELPSYYDFEIINLDNELLPYPENYFDAIIFNHVIEHLHNPFHITKEIHRVLSPGGRIYIETPNWTSMLVPSFSFNRHQHSPFNFYDDPTHVKPWTKHGLYEYLSQFCGLKVLKARNTRNWMKLPFDLIRIVFSLIGGNRQSLIASFWNIYGWSIYSIGRKDK